MLVPEEVVHLHVCLDAVWNVAGPHRLHKHVPGVGSHDYKHLKTIFNEVMLVNEKKVRNWILNTATAISGGRHA